MWKTGSEPSAPNLRTVRASTREDSAPEGACYFQILASSIPSIFIIFHVGCPLQNFLESFLSQTPHFAIVVRWNAILRDAESGCDVSHSANFSQFFSLTKTNERRPCRAVAASGRIDHICVRNAGNMAYDIFLNQLDAVCAISQIYKPKAAALESLNCFFHGICLKERQSLRAVQREHFHVLRSL